MMNESRSGSLRKNWHNLLILTILMTAVLVPAGAGTPGLRDLPFTPQEIHTGNATLPDPSQLPEYQLTPEPVRIHADLDESSLPVSKGEMAGGPRTIGFTLDPVLLAAGIIVFMACGICALCLLRREAEDKNHSR